MKKTALTNHYFLQRHGNSRANQKGIIVSNPELGIKEYGLTDLGKEQVLKAADYFQKEDRIIIFSSDFKRAKETAVIMKEKLTSEYIIYTPQLRERFFGYYDGLDDSQYSSVWEKDINDKNNKENSVESPVQVAERTETLIEYIESEYDNRNILLVSHGDCLQILQTVFEGISPAAHRSLSHLQTAEVRKM